MKVLLLVDSLALGGAETLLGTLIRSAPEAGLEFSVAALGGRLDGRDVLHRRLVEAGVVPTFLDVPRLASVRAVPAVIRAIRASRCAVVHAHLEYAAILGGVAARLARRPIVSTFHHVPAVLDRREALKERLAVDLAGRGTKVIFVSEASRAAFAERYRVRPSWTTLPNAVEISAFDPSRSALPDDLAELLQVLPDARRRAEPVVAIVANLRPGKGHDQALRIWSRVLEQVPAARLLLIGAGDLEDDLRQQATRYGHQEPAVVFAGLRSDIPSILAGVDLVLLPSRSEALPTTLVEAAAAGRPVVATRVGGVPEVVVDGVTGRLVPPEDDDALVAALVDLLTDRAERERLGSAARRHAEQNFDAAGWVRRLAKIYSAAAGGAP